MRAPADDFGAAVGRGLTQVGAGLEQVSDTQAAITRMTSEAHATNAANQWVQRKNELLYNPDNGYSNDGAYPNHSCRLLKSRNQTAASSFRSQQSAVD
ncbi:hypothetical protein ACIQUB_30200 [Rhizobium sp. NPDC090275]|uniref:hypothetical protein n=1 Tax=Rhizobium sp. NPDC090275 TaxID=3364498 RepID=UPI003839D2A9